MKKKKLSRRKFIGKIGAGTAGVAAAYAVAQVPPVKRLLEARPRLGGLSFGENPHAHLSGPASIMRPPFPRPQWHALGYGLENE